MAACAAVLLSALGAVVLAAVNRPAPVLGMVGFELVILAACVMGWRSCRWPADRGVAMTMLCVAGCIGAGTFLGYLASGRMLLGVSLNGFLLARLFAAGAIAGCAAVEVLRHNPREAAWRLVLGLMLVAPVFAVAALWMRGVVPRALGAIGASPQALVMIFGFLFLTGLFAAGVHFAISAFERALAAAEQGDQEVGQQKVAGTGSAPA